MSKSLAFTVAAAILGSLSAVSFFHRFESTGLTPKQSFSDPIAEIQKVDMTKLKVELSVLSISDDEKNIIRKFGSDSLAKDLQIYFIGYSHLQDPSKKAALAFYVIKHLSDQPEMGVAALVRAGKAIPADRYPAQKAAFQALAMSIR